MLDENASDAGELPAENKFLTVGRPAGILFERFVKSDLGEFELCRFCGRAPVANGLSPITGSFTNVSLASSV
jgi:hypothetical protein